MGINNVVLTGRLTRDPELKYTQSGKALANFTIAVSRQYNRDEADFIYCSAWEKRAELIAEYFRKGSQIGIEGSIRTRTYEEESGKKRTMTEVLVSNIEFLETKKSAGGSDYSAPASGGNSTAAADDDDDFPF